MRDMIVLIVFHKGTYPMAFRPCQKCVGPCHCLSVELHHLESSFVGDVMQCLARHKHDAVQAVYLGRQL